MSFSKDFVWGAATAAYQVEGAAYEDGKGLSVWDAMCKRPGKIWRGCTGDTACDHYHRYQEDVDLMTQVGLGAYRFSISWPRVLPEGVGKVNEAGLAFYDRLVDTLLEAGIQPWATLFHWDYPYELYKRGGWLNRSASDWFAEYTGVIVDRLSDRVRHWMTLNEPQCTICMGHYDGLHAPGLQLPINEVLLAAHNLLLAHGKAVQVIRAKAKAAPSVGWAPVGSTHTPATDSADDIEAARQRMFRMVQPHPWSNTWFSDPVVLGEYPADGLEVFATDAPAIQPGDMETICQPLDFYGVNIYQAQMVRMGADGPEDVEFAKDYPITHYDWPVTPEAMYWGPTFFQERYKLPIVVTENGMASHDWISLDGACHDPQRIDFMHRYLREYRRAAADGVDLMGYFAWTFLDNFEWAQGYRLRFGLTHIDFETFKRTLKDSALWYRDVIASNGENL